MKTEVIKSWKLPKYLPTQKMEDVAQAYKTVVGVWFHYTGVFFTYPIGFFTQSSETLVQ